MENWKEIPGYSGKYLVSDLGKIKSLRRMEPTILVGGIDTSGYHIVTLRNNGVQKTTTIHRLVASAFLPNPESKRTVNHKNGIKTDNRVENLEWNTYQENIIHAVRAGLNVSKRGVCVVQENEDGEAIATFRTIREAAKSTGISSPCICMCINGSYKQAGGFKFKRLYK